VKLFIAEPGSDEMVRFASTEDDRNKVVSALSQVEHVRLSAGFGRGIQLPLPKRLRLSTRSSAK